MALSTSVAFSHSRSCGGISQRTGPLPSVCGLYSRPSSSSALQACVPHQKKPRRNPRPAVVVCSTSQPGQSKVVATMKAPAASPIRHIALSAAAAPLTVSSVDTVSSPALAPAPALSVFINPTIQAEAAPPSVPAPFSASHSVAQVPGDAARAYAAVDDVCCGMDLASTLRYMEGSKTAPGVIYVTRPNELQELRKVASQAVSFLFVWKLA